MALQLVPDFALPGFAPDFALPGFALDFALPGFDFFLPLGTRRGELAAAPGPLATPAEAQSMTSQTTSCRHDLTMKHAIRQQLEPSRVRYRRVGALLDGSLSCFAPTYTNHMHHYSSSQSKSFQPSLFRWTCVEERDFRKLQIFAIRRMYGFCSVWQRSSNARTIARTRL
jgi:hypothetical protein